MDVQIHILVAEVKNGAIRKTHIAINLVFTEEFIYEMFKMKFVII